MPPSLQTAEPYRAPVWLPGGDLQTIWPVVLGRPKLDYRRERWELPDGDFIDLDWVDGPSDAPLLVLFHGLEGNSDSHYVRHLLDAARRRGWRGVAPHFRGCSGELNRLPRAYYAGDVQEIGAILQRLARAGSGPLWVAGVSLGGNVLLKWLAQEGAAARQWVQRAAALSAPLDLPAAGATLDQGFCRLYTARFLKTLKAKALAKLERFPHLYDRKAVAAITRLHTFDTLVTTPLHGYRDADDYWRQAASKPDLDRIQVATLVLNARNDPFMPGSVLPSADQVSPWVTLDFPEEGGHVGFPSGPFPGNFGWLRRRVLDFLTPVAGADG